MEQSHMNNTPTAVFYDQVINKLGGQSPALKQNYRDAIDGFPCIVYYNDNPDTDTNTLVGSFMFNIDKAGAELGFECDIIDDEGTIIGNGSQSCVSYEGTANASDTAGCFYTFEESIQNVYKYYIEDAYKEYLAELGLTEYQVTLPQFQEMVNNNELDYKNFEEYLQDYDEIDYVMSDFEARYSFNEDDDVVTYTPMLNLINWISKSVEDGTFKDEFDDHFDRTYMLAYYLQMQVFTQVDNCGKNCMWDTWDGVKFYPRPYDMDTSMGLSNTGTETIMVEAELMPELSPYEATGTFAGYSNSDSVTELRYLSFNTKTSKLWNNFAKEFAEEIKTTYRELRNAGVYTVNNICNHARSMTYDKIGEIYYNKDAASKYLSQTNENNSEYLKMLHGNRIQKYKKFITDRLTFLDTVYDYMESEIQTDTLNSVITLRSDALYGSGLTGVGESLRCYLGIAVYSPQYVTITVGSGMDAIVTAFVSPDSRYIDPDNGLEYEGTLFSFPIKGTDKEMIISGAGNIKAINKLQDLNVRDLTITKAQKLTSLNLTGSSRMSALNLGNNKFLRELNCSNSFLLGTGVNGQSLNLSQCGNLRKLDITKTQLTSVIFPENGNMTDIVLKGSSVKSFDVNGMEFLENIDISECESMTTFNMNGCPKIETVDISKSTIRNFAATNCDHLKTVNVSACQLLTEFDITNSDNVENLYMDNNLSSIMNDLKLYSIYNLKRLHARNTTSLKNIRLPKYANAVEAAKAANGEPAELWGGLVELLVNDSAFESLQYGSADVTNPCVDMSQISNISNLNWSNCKSIKEIKNINYIDRNLARLFYGLSGLTKITGSISNATANKSIDRIFSGCTALNNIDGLTLNLTGINDAQYAMDGCRAANLNMLKKILNACGSTVTNITGIAQSSGASGTIPADLFTTNTNVVNAANIFKWSGISGAVPGTLFDPFAETVTTLNTAFGGCGLTSVGNELLKNKPKLTDVGGMFANNTNLVSYIDTDPNIFVESPNITNVSQLFINCNKLAVGELGLGRMFDDVPKIQNATAVFAACHALNCEIPEGFLSKNPEITNINALFSHCINLPKIPNSLFREKITDTNTFSKLAEARGVFNNCTNMKGHISANFFEGAPNINNLSNVTIGIVMGGNHSTSGCFANSGIEGYHEDFLKPLTNLVNVSYLFYQQNQNYSLETCRYFDNNGVEQEYVCGVSDKLFANNKFIQTSAYCFHNCAGLKGHIPEAIFDTCKGSLKNVSYMFSGCTGLTGVNLDNTDEEVNNNTGISSSWFKNARELTDISHFMNGCNQFNGEIPSDFLQNCVKLERTSACFRGCSQLSGHMPIELFNSCRSTIKDTSGMFSGCENIYGEFPTGEYVKSTGLVSYELCNASDDGALEVVSAVSDYDTQVAYNIVLTLNSSLSSSLLPDVGLYVKPVMGEVTTIVQPGFLAECLNLENISGMFSDCYKLGQGSEIPYDILFTSSATVRYTKLKNAGNLFYRCAFDQPHVDEVSGENYFCDANILSKCPALTNVGGMFSFINVGPALIYQNMLARQTSLQNAGWLFAFTSVTGPITSNLLANSLGTLTGVGAMFASTGVTSVDSGFLNLGNVNKKLTHVGSLFQGCSNLTGTCPEFWNPLKFPNIEMSQGGYYGAVNSCTNLTNYNDALAVSSNWTVWVTL